MKSKMSPGGGERKEMKYTLAFHAEGKKDTNPVQFRIGRKIQILYFSVYLYSIVIVVVTLDGYLVY